MPSSFTSGRADLEKPSNGSFVDTWDSPVNANMDAIDACISATTGVTFTTGTVTLTQAQMRCQRVSLGGTLSGNCQLNFFAGIPGLYTIVNATTQGAFSITIAQNAGNTIVLPVGFQSLLVFVDGTNVFFADDGGIRLICAQFVPPGAIMDFGMSSAPGGWLVCDGSAISRTTFSGLFANIGTTWGVGNGSTTFNLPPFQGQFRRGWDQSGLIDPARTFASSQGDLFGVHNHGTNELPHSHTIAVSNAINQAGFNNTSPGLGPNSLTTSGAVTGLTIQNAGGSETRPKNYAVLTCIKT